MNYFELLVIYYIKIRGLKEIDGSREKYGNINKYVRRSVRVEGRIKS